MSNEQPPALADGVVRCRVQEHPERDGRIVLRSALIHCPGCGNLHSLPIRGSLDPTWKYASSCQNRTWDYDGNAVAPTFSPSLRCFHTRRDGTEQTDCHTFIKGGWIQFLDDSAAHQLRGWHKLPEMRPLDEEHEV